MNIKFSLLFPCFLSLSSYAQQVNISASADRSEMKIGEQVCYKITIETDSTAQVIFPDTYQFTPFEVVNEIPIDTFREREKFRLIKEYSLPSLIQDITPFLLYELMLIKGLIRPILCDL